MKNLIIILALVILGCAQEKFKPDKRDPRLPKYTEKGNQVGGALLNNLAWKTNYEAHFFGAEDAFYMTTYQSGDSLVVKLTGALNEGVNQGRLINLLFVLKSVPLPAIGHMGKLNNMRFALDGIDRYAMIEDYDNFYNPGVSFYRGGVGELYFKNVKERSHITLGSGKDAIHPFIVSGTFHFTINQHGQLFEVRNGRFDFHFTNLELR